MCSFLALILFTGLFVYAKIDTARKQRKAKAETFRDFADRNGLRYQEEDDGKAQGFARDFDGIGQFSSPSIGKVTPKDVVYGIMDGAHVIVFRHSTRFSEGWAREWFFAGAISTEPIAERCALQFCKGQADESTMYLEVLSYENKMGPLTWLSGRRMFFPRVGWYKGIFWSDWAIVRGISPSDPKSRCGENESWPTLPIGTLRPITSRPLQTCWNS